MGDDVIARFAPAAILILLGVGVFFVGRSGLVEVNCSGWSAISPACWSGSALNVAYEVTCGAIAAALIMLGAIWTMLGSPEQRKYFMAFILLSALLAADLILPDPIPFIDELIFVVLAGFAGIKTFTAK